MNNSKIKNSRNKDHTKISESTVIKIILKRKIKKEVVILRVESYFFGVLLRYEMPFKFGFHAN